jgi:dolichol-phosphate mannosyltransferase
VNAVAPARQTESLVRPAPELCVVVPVFRHGAAIAGIVDKLRSADQNGDWDIVFVDDNSPDDTVAAVRALGARDSRVRAIRRVGRNGLTQTCLAAMVASRARFVAMIEPDADFDPALLTTMLERLRGGDADLVVATRGRVPGGRLRTLARRALSAITRRALSTDMRDPTSGLFMLRRDALEDLTPSLSSLGYQVLLDLVATARGRLRVVEVAGGYRAHGGGRSELKLALELLALMIAKFSNDAVSIRFMLFCLVGLSGVGVHLAILDVALVAFSFTVAQTVATLLTTIWNYSLNNVVTYGDQRLTGWSYFTGLVRFQLVCGIGLISNVGVASLIYANETTWWLAGLGGALMGAVWNYAVSAVFVWRPR